MFQMRSRYKFKYRKQLKVITENMFDLNSNARHQLAFDDRTIFAMTKNAKS